MPIDTLPAVLTAMMAAGTPADSTPGPDRMTAATESRGAADDGAAIRRAELERRAAASEMKATAAERRAVANRRAHAARRAAEADRRSALAERRADAARRSALAERRADAARRSALAERRAEAAHRSALAERRAMAVAPYDNTEMRKLRRALHAEMTSDTPNPDTLNGLYRRIFELDPVMSIYIRSIITRTMALTR